MNTKLKLGVSEDEAQRIDGFSILITVMGVTPRLMQNDGLLDQPVTAFSSMNITEMLRILASQGQRVKAGQPILVLDNVQESAALDASRDRRASALEIFRDGLCDIESEISQSVGG